MAGSEPNGLPETTLAPAPDPDSYEWELLIEAPLAFDFFRLVRALFRFPGRVSDEVLQHQRKTRKRYYLEILAYNAGLLCLIVLMIPFLMLAFSYVATLPFLSLRLASSAFGDRPMVVVSALGLVATLTVPVVLFLLMIRPTAYRDAYKRSKVELFHISIALSLFLASGMLESLIASPALRLIKNFEGPVNSTLQWTLFFADKAMNVLFANLPNKLFGPLSEIDVREDGSEVTIGMLRVLQLFGFAVFVRLMALKLCISKKELFYGTVAELKSYLDYCGKAEARTIRKVIPLPDDEVIVVRNKHRPPPDPPGEPSREAEASGALHH
jgi:hypothetical protein